MKNLETSKSEGRKAALSSREPSVQQLSDPSSRLRSVCPGRLAACWSPPAPAFVISPLSSTLSPHRLQ
ncbi:hypothetical protein E2C01_031884 [Portunus trituberculatus]|uniref:Uncharacterized protein n=1 Tax=Portunus trituberculatus TaxID=210409 RepID=A0A5B7EZD5_PORTR|nr:hypothetical protein [Portunus trituberculatus]